MEANFSAGYSTTAHGEDSNSLEGVINMPIIADKFAVRGVVYNEQPRRLHRQYSGNFTRKATDLGVGYQSAPVRHRRQRRNCPSLSNADLAGRDINPAIYKGWAVSAL